MYNKFIESDEWMAQTTSLSDRFGLRFHLSRPLAIRESLKSNGEFRVGKTHCFGMEMGGFGAVATSLVICSI
jgi:hypothetical protein